MIAPKQIERVLGSRKNGTRQPQRTARPKTSGFVRSLIVSPLGTNPERDAAIRKGWSQGCFPSSIG